MWITGWIPFYCPGLNLPNTSGTYYALIFGAYIEITSHTFSFRPFCLFFKFINTNLKQYNSYFQKNRPLAPILFLILSIKHSTSYAVYESLRVHVYLFFQWQLSWNVSVFFSTLLRQFLFDMIFITENIVLLCIALNSNILEIQVLPLI